MKKLSIIVPVYNVAKYLGKCLDSLLVQDIPPNQYEIIIVNDGSTDGSLFVAESYVNQYPNIKLISQENRGLGAARNSGLKEAKGKCVFFVDSDDYVLTYSLSELLNCFESNKLDALRFNYIAVNEGGECVVKKKNATHNIVFSDKVVDGQTFLSEYLGWACYVWVFLFDAKFLKENNFLFDENIYFEDVEWLVRVMMAAKRVQSVDKQVYFYLQRNGSITQSVQLEKKNKTISDKLYIVGMLKSLASTTKNRKVVLWCEGMISLTFMGILFFVENELPERKKEIIELLNIKRFLPLKSFHFTLKQNRDLFIINLSPKLYCYLRRKKR